MLRAVQGQPLQQVQQNQPAAAAAPAKAVPLALKVAAAAFPSFNVVLAPEQFFVFKGKLYVISEILTKVPTKHIICLMDNKGNTLHNASFVPSDRFKVMKAKLVAAGF